MSIPPLTTPPLVRPQAELQQSELININNAGIMRYYPFDTDALDYQSGVGEDNATISNISISKDSTKLNKGSMYFPGNNTQSFKLPPFSFGKDGITIAVWMRCPVIPTNWVRICDFGNKYDNPSSAFVIGFLPTDSSTAGKPFVGIKTNSVGVDGNFPMNCNTPDTNWHHYALVIQPTGALSFYLDGVAKPSVNNNVSYPSLEQMASSFIGKSNWIGDESIKCYMNQFVMFNRPLTSIEIGYLASNPLNVRFSSKASGMYTIGSSPTITNITNITNGQFGFIINFSSGKQGSHAVTTYYYSLDGGSTYRDANTTMSPITITGIQPNTYYQVVLVASSVAGNTLPSNIVTGFIANNQVTGDSNSNGQYVYLITGNEPFQTLSNPNTKNSFSLRNSCVVSPENLTIPTLVPRSGIFPIYDYYTFRPKFT